MKSTHRIAAAALALALLGAGGAVADHKKDQVTAKQAANTVGSKVIAVQAWAENLTAGAEARYGIAPTNEAIPVNVGDRVRVRLVGTAIEADGDGVEIPVHARFFEASGTSRLDILERGPNWVVVRIGDRDRLRNDDRAQLAFEVTGRYDMRNNLESGRITFDLGGRGSSSLGLSQGSDRERLQGSERLTALLYDAILLENTSSLRRDTEFNADVDRIYRDGYEAVIQVARDLARQAEERSVFRGHSSREVVAHLYRLLLGRTGSERQIEDSDPGFLSNVRELERRGLYEVVDTIVRSEEFHRVHNLTGFTRLR